MEDADALRAERDELEHRLIELERAIEAQRLRLVAVDGVAQDEADSAASVSALLDQLGPVNAKLAELRGPGNPT